MNRVTNDEITHISGNEIFVFGSNLSGKHVGGAAKVAMKWGAVWGNPIGLQGNTYAIPTVNKECNGTLTVDEIRLYSDEFIRFARVNPNLTFYLTEVGCGIAGLTIKEVAPLFKRAINVENIWMPSKFWRELAKNEIKDE